MWSHNRTPVGRLLPFGPGKVCTRICSITEQPSRFPTSQSRTSNSVPYGSPASMRRRYEVSTFHISDTANDVGVPWTPVVKRFRASTLDACNLTTRYSHRGIACDLLHLSRSVAFNDAYGHSDVFTLSFLPWPFTGEVSRRGRPVSIPTQFGTLSMRLRTLSSAQRQHAHVGISRTILSII